jgi:hypothetical protein
LGFTPSRPDGLNDYPLEATNVAHPPTTDGNGNRLRTLTTDAKLRL